LIYRRLYMIALIIALSFASCFLLCYGIMSCIRADRISISLRLKSIAKSNNANDNSELDKPLFTRVLRPMLDNIGKVMVRITPAQMVSSLEKKITKAGNPGNMGVKSWINIQALLAIGLPIITLLAVRKAIVPAGTVMALILSEVVLGFVLPGFILGKILKARQNTILNSLADVIDLLTVSVEAGLSFDSALMKVIEKKPGPLAKEFEKTLQEIKVGKLKRDALKDLAQRVDVQDFTSFIGAVVQADQFGIAIANVLRIQAGQIREKRRQRTRERAAKVPVKMLIPMVVFIFPVLFIVLLGPVVLQLMEQFSGM